MRIIKIILFFLLIAPVVSSKAFAKESWWRVQSIDTVKYSRDVARAMLEDKDFESVIDAQVRAIAETGATHVAIGTPYDEEFLPFLRKWVIAARLYDLKVWFRGNFSGWEGWFGYDSLTRNQHLDATKKFIGNHADVFEAGDIFSPCPECENGGPGDPRLTGDIDGYRRFLKDLYITCTEQFRLQGKNVFCNYFSMNGDVAKLVMDEATTKSLGGIVVVDHYVKTPEMLAKDIEIFAKSSGGKVVLGEFGAPIPDIHGNLTEKEQAEWIKKALALLSKSPNLVGINYWTNVGGSTTLWDSSLRPRLAKEVIQQYYTPKILKVTVRNVLQEPITRSRVDIEGKSYLSDNFGNIQLIYLEDDAEFLVSADGYEQKRYLHSDLQLNTYIELEKSNEDWWFRLRHFLLKIKRSFTL